jgi:glutamate synthase (NADPH) large chain
MRKTVRAFGLFDPAREHDACGVGFIVNLKNRPSQRIVQNGLSILENLVHRGAVGADPLMGDGAGIMVQIPHKFFMKEAERHGWRLPEAGKYAVAFIFMPQDAELRRKMERVVEKVIEDEGQTVIGWRDVPSDNSSLSKAPDIVATEPCGATALRTRTLSSASSTSSARSARARSTRPMPASRRISTSSR